MTTPAQKQSPSPTRTTVKCPTCKADVIWGEISQYRPFCSKQCQIIDFGEWADEEKAIPGAPDMSDSDRWSEG